MAIRQDSKAFFSLHFCPDVVSVIVQCIEEATFPPILYMGLTMEGNKGLRVQACSSAT